MNRPILLIVDDEKPARDALRIGFQDDYDVYAASNIEQASAILESEPVDLILTDLRLGGESGMDILSLAAKQTNIPACIVMTAYGSVDTAVAAMKRGAYDFVTKPLNFEEVDIILKRALHTRKLETVNRDLEIRLNPNRGLEKLLGHSEAMERVFRIIRQVAPSRATVLVEGESGTGKELVAQAIHALSPRAQKPFVAVNCAALSPQLLESELFGHEKGSFTGAIQRRIGRFEQAEGGTIFLDEIGEISPETQVKLLRVLSEKTIERVGSNTPINIDVRIIAATNKSLSRLVAEGAFREDLFFRLNVVGIQMPPLRDRKEDIVLLSHSFLKEFSEEAGRNAKPITPRAMQLLASYDWPGNVRELRTAIEHGVVMSDSDQIDVEHLPASLSTASATLPAPDTPAPEGRSPVSSDSCISDKENIGLVAPNELNLALLECEAIKQALLQTKGNKTEAAELLGISRRTLQRKISGS